MNTTSDLIQTRTDRLHYIDVMKGLLILYLPIYHFHPATTRLEIYSPYEWIITKWQDFFAIFFMAAFFFVSGYCSNFDKNKDEFLKSQFKQLILPFITFTSILIIRSLIRFGDFTGVSRYLFNPPYTDLWFISALIISKFALFGILKTTKSKIKVLMVSFFTLCLGLLLNHYNIGINIFAFYHALIALFFLSAGYVYKRCNITIQDTLEKVCIPLYIFLIIIYFIYCRKSLNFTVSIHCRPILIPLFVALTLLGTISTLKVSKIIRNNRIIEYFGRNSLIVYAMHFIFLYEIINLYNILINPCSYIQYVVFIFFVYVTEYYVCYLICKLFNRNPFCKAIGK